VQNFSFFDVWIGSITRVDHTPDCVYVCAFNRKHNMFLDVSMILSGGEIPASQCNATVPAPVAVRKQT
jgi:hypothetical protein